MFRGDGIEDRADPVFEGGDSVTVFRGDGIEDRGRGTGLVEYRGSMECERSMMTAVGRARRAGAAAPGAVFYKKNLVCSFL